MRSGCLNIYKDIGDSIVVKKDSSHAKEQKGFMEEDEEVLSEKEEAELKEKLKYYGYI